MLNLATATATELLTALERRKVSSLELVDGYLDRIARLNGPLNAVITLDAERARARARELDAWRARSDAHGPLHGLPLTIKDAFETEGLRTVSGAKPYAAHVPAANAVAVQRLVDAGAIVLGKTNVPAYCADVQTFNEVFGVTHNPHDRTRTPGGSSGGAAVAVACGFTSFELGSDIGGSIRTPAGWTGVYGHKPSYGLVPMGGHIPGPPGMLARWDLNVAGPLARSAEDLALALSVLAGPEGQDAKAYRLALPAPRCAALRDYRVGAWFDAPGFPLDPELRAVLDGVVEGLESVGARVERLDEAVVGISLTALVDDYLKLMLPVMMSGMPQASVDGLVQVAQGSAPGASEQLLRVARSATLRHVEWLAVDERRAHLRRRFAQLFERFDVLLLPLHPVAAIPHEHEGTSTTRTITVSGVARPYFDLFGWIAPATACYLPATAAPVGRTPGGLPVGVQIVGDYLEDHTTMAFAEHLGELVGGFVPPAGLG